MFAEFKTESGSDYLRIYDGPSTSSDLLENLNGLLPTPHIVTSTGSSLWFQFEADSDTADRGFRATFAAVEGLSSRKREIKLPSFPIIYIYSRTN